MVNAKSVFTARVNQYTCEKASSAAHEGQRQIDRPTVDGSGIGPLEFDVPSKNFVSRIARGPSDSTCAGSKKSSFSVGENGSPNDAGCTH